MLTCAGVAQLGLDLAKATFDNTAASLGPLQANVEDRLVDAVRGAAWIPGLFSGLVCESIGAARQARSAVTATVDEGYAWLSHLLGRA